MGNDLLMARVDLTPILDGHVSFPIDDCLSTLNQYIHAARLGPMVRSNRGLRFIPSQDRLQANQKRIPDHRSF